MPENEHHLIPPDIPFPRRGETTIEMLLSLLCGLSLFLFGMALLGESLQQLAGGRMEAALRRMTNGRWKGMALGFGVTAVIQSSSATTVLAVSLADSGVLNLRQVIPLIIGANVGTTVTAWLLCLGGTEQTFSTALCAVLAVTGLSLYLFFPQHRMRGAILLGLFLLLSGMDQMTAAAAPLAEEAAFVRLLQLTAHPTLGVLAGALFTGVLQSSSASVGLLQAFSASGMVSWAAAIPLILGQNIGTCVTALLASIGGGANAKRAALSHLYFNIIGAVGMLLLCRVCEDIFFFMEQPIDAVGIAIVHTGFNLLSALTMLPITGALEKLVLWRVPAVKRNRKGILTQSRK